MTTPNAATTHAPVDRRIQDRLERELGATRFERYFERHALLDFDGGALRVRVPSAFHADWLDRRFGAAVRAALVAEAGGAARVRWDVDPSAFEREETQDAQAVIAPSPVEREAARPKRARPSRRTHTDAWSRHDLDAFIVGPSSRLAHSMSVQVANEDESPVSVLFIHGPCGVGKTHLLQGIARRYAQKRPGARVRYVSGENFANQYIASVHAGNIDSFRERYRGVDLLCIDDVHFLRGKEKTQSEFLHTFEALDLEGSRVVLASDGHPRRIKDLHEGIVSRCLSGMVAKLDLPDRATREVIARTLLAKRGLVADEASVKELAAEVAGSVRELEGAVKRVEAFARLLPTEDAWGGRVTVALVRRALGSAARSMRSRPVRLEEVLEAACAETGVTRDEVLSTSRHTRVVLARGLMGLVARGVTSASYPEIARAIGRKNHSTVITACLRVEKQIASGAGVTLTPGAGETPVADVYDRVRARLSREAA